MPDTHMKRFSFELPDEEDKRGKTHVSLVRSDLVRGAVQVVYEGGETNLHSHSGNDGFWYVLAGRALFYEDEDTLYADLGPNEGVLIPRGTPYWFESGSSEPLQILHVSAKAQNVEDQRTDITPPSERGYRLIET